MATVGLLALSACEPAAVDDTAATENETPAEAISLGDWPIIKERGTIRLARRSWDGFDTLPSQGLSAEQYRHLAERFAKRHGLAVEWILAADMDGLFRAVEEGRADIAVSNITVTEARRERAAFSLTLTRSREWVVGTTEDGVFGVAAHTAYEETLGRHFPHARRAPVPAAADPLDFQTMIEDGVIDATIMDEAAARVVVRTGERVAKLRELPEMLDHAWALRHGNPALKEVLDAYLLQRHLVHGQAAEERRDWPAIVASGRLRMLTLNAPTTYYLWRGELLGFEYELIGAFAAAHDLQLEALVAPSHGELFDWLAAGRGDVIAAGLTPTPERGEQGLRFTRPYLRVRETFVTAGEPIAALADLAGRRLAVNSTTSYARTLAALDAGVAFDVDFVEQQTETILDAVAAGELDATLADSHYAELAATFSPELSLGLALEPERGLAWAVRKENAELHRRLDGFVGEGYRSYEFNVLRNKYFVNQRRMAQQREHRITGEALSPYDHIVRPLAAAADIDWRLVVAQMYQESGFDPYRVSFAGAVGLLQVMPRTAREVGVDPAKLKDPEIGILAGIRYLAWTRQRFPNLPVGEQLWFALAAYNAGPGHVRDGRRLARRLGLDGSLWFDNVEQAMLKLAEPEYARLATYGYVRGTEVAGYVRDIRDRYRAYLDHFRMLDAGSS